MNKKRKELVLSILGILGLIVITAGVTYAFFNYAKEGTTDNVITTGSITFLYTEVSGVGHGINIENAYPISDEVGKVKTGEGEYFDFKITSDTFEDSSIPYEVTARKKADSTLDEEAVRMYLVDQDTNEELLLDNFSNLNQTSKVEASKHIEKTIYTGKVPADTKDYEKNFRLRMWIDENVDFSQNEDGTYPYNGKTFTITVNVYANAKVITADEEELMQSANIKTLEVAGTELTAVENQNYNYEMTLPAGTTETEINVETENENATVSIERIDSLAYINNIKRLSAKKTLNVVSGENYFKITVTSETKEVIKEYKLKVIVQSQEMLLTDAIFNKFNTIYTEPTLDSSVNNTADSSGLYKWTDPDDSSINTYYFRGNVTNNYVDFAGFTWRVLRINEDGTIRLITEESINNDEGYGFSANNIYTMYYNKSNIKQKLETWYANNIAINSKYSEKVATGDYFCSQAKAKAGSSFSGSNATMTLYSTYKPDFSCVTDGNGYGIINASVGLITYDEAVYAGAYPTESNTNYYLNNNRNYWTMSPAGVDSSSSTGTGHVWAISSTGDLINLNNIYSDPQTLRPVINLNVDVTVTGSGSSGDHWIVQ